MMFGAQQSVSYLGNPHWVILTQWVGQNDQFGLDPMEQSLFASCSLAFGRLLFAQAVSILERFSSDNVEISIRDSNLNPKKTGSCSESWKICRFLLSAVFHFRNLESRSHKRRSKRDVLLHCPTYNLSLEKQPLAHFCPHLDVSIIFAAKIPKIYSSTTLLKHQ